MSELAEFVRDIDDGCTLSVRVHPGAKRDAVLGPHAGALKVLLSALPVDERANDAVIAFIAEKLDLPLSRVKLVAGMSSRSKTLRITGRSAAEVQAALLPEEEC
jgi:uncharacterized protein